MTAAEWSPAIYRASCRRCPRLARHLDLVRREHPDYFAAPVPPFGARRPWLLIVGLAPGMHGANASGRPFTGDHAGILLYRTLHRYGLSSRPESRSRGDSLRLRGCRITNAVKCLPPANRPTTAEVCCCNGYLRHEIADLGAPLVILALGRVAHEAVLRALDRKLSGNPFAHGAVHRLGPRRRMLDSYHCSRYNTQTGRLTPRMFQDVIGKAVELSSLSD